MTTYYMNEGAFDLPDLGFKDKTVHLFSASRGERGEIGLFIARSPLPKDKTLDQMVKAHIDDDAKSMKAFAVSEQRSIDVDGARAIDVSMRYKSRSEMAYQRQTHFVAYGLWILIGATAPLEARALADECVDQVIGSFRLRAM